jgi:YVTN family beta-propeller protein
MRLAHALCLARYAPLLALAHVGHAGQVPGAASVPDIPVGHRDRVYAAEQFSNTVSVTDPASNQLLGVIRLGEPAPANFSPLYHGQVLVHGLGFSPDHHTLAVVSIGSNSVTFIDTATNMVKHTTYVGRSPHEAFFTPDGKELWVTVRGENYVSVIDAATFLEKARVLTPNGPGMQIFSPDGRYAYICSSFTPETVIVQVSSRAIVGRVRQESPFCPNIAATPDGRQVWLTLKDSGKTQIFEAKPPFAPIKTLNTGAITNHVNFVNLKQSIFAYVSVGGLNQVKVFRVADFAQVATINVGNLPHGVWPSADGTRIYVGLENDDALVAIDTSSNTVVGQIPIGQAPQALVYVSEAVAEGAMGVQGLQPLGLAACAAHLELESESGETGKRARTTSVTLFDQGLVQVLEASVTGLVAGGAYVLALSNQADGKGELQPLAEFKANPAGAAIVNTIGPIRQVVHSQDSTRRFLVIAPRVTGGIGAPVQVQVRDTTSHSDPCQPQAQ